MNTVSSPSIKEKLVSKGLESFIKGSYSEATTHFEEILSNTPNDSDTLHHLAGCQIQLRQYEAAQASIEKALGINPKNPLAWFMGGQVLIHNGDINDGILALKNALIHNPTSEFFNEVYIRYSSEYKKNIAAIVTLGAAELPKI